MERAIENCHSHTCWAFNETWYAVADSDDCVTERVVCGNF